MRVHWRDSLLLATATLGISFCFLISPLMLRSLMDGIMVTGDILAISIAILSIAFCEISSIVMNMVLRHQIDHLQNHFIANNQKTFLNRWATGEIQPDKKEAQRFWFSDLTRVANLVIRQRWMRVRDVTLVVILGSAAITMNTVSGVFLVGFILAHIATGIFLNSRWGLAHYAARSLHEKEEDLLHGVTASINKWRDQGRISGEVTKIHDQLALISSKRLQLDRLRSVADDIFRSFRALAILGVLCLAFKAASDGDGSVGSIWALILVTYRILGPAESLSKWVLEEQRAKHQVERWHRWLNLKTQKHSEPPALYSPIKAHLQSSAEKKAKNFLLADDQARANFLAAARIWRDRVASRFNVLIFDQDMDFSVIQDPLDSRAKLIILSGISSGCSDISATRARLSALQQSTPASWIILDSVLWMDQPKSYFLHHLDLHSGLSRVERRAEKSPAALRPVDRSLLTQWCQYDSKFGDFYRDLLRFNRMSVPMTIAYLHGLSTQNLEHLNHRRRDYDHLVAVPGGGHLVAFSNCSLELSMEIFERILPGAIEALEQKHWVQLHSDLDETARSLPQVELFLVNACLGALEKVPPEVSQEMAS